MTPDLKALLEEAAEAKRGCKEWAKTVRYRYRNFHDLCDLAAELDDLSALFGRLRAAASGAGEPVAFAGPFATADENRAYAAGRLYEQQQHECPGIAASPEPVLCSFPDGCHEAATSHACAQHAAFKGRTYERPEFHVEDESASPEPGEGVKCAACYGTRICMAPSCHFDGEHECHECHGSGRSGGSGG